MHSVITSGTFMSESNLPEWEQLLSAAAHLQEILPDATLVGGTAVAIFAKHRLSRDADHVLPDLRHRFDEVLAELEAVAGWRTARVKRPVLILGSLDGIETGVRQMIREQPLETQEVAIGDVRLVVPTEEELLRIKGVLILRRNATRDYLDFAALSERIGPARVNEALAPLDQLYPQTSGESSLQQLQVQLANPMPYDLDNTSKKSARPLPSISLTVCKLLGSLPNDGDIDLTRLLAVQHTRQHCYTLFCECVRQIASGRATSV
jgi:hypothetical protein